MKADQLGKLVKRHLDALARGKKGYKLADALLDTVERELKPGQRVGLPSGKTVIFVDKFAEKTKVNVGQNCRRYCFEEAPLA